MPVVYLLITIDCSNDIKYNIKFESATVCRNLEQFEQYSKNSYCLRLLAHKYLPFAYIWWRYWQTTELETVADCRRLSLHRRRDQTRWFVASASAKWAGVSVDKTVFSILSMSSFQIFMSAAVLSRCEVNPSTPATPTRRDGLESRHVAGVN